MNRALTLHQHDKRTTGAPFRIGTSDASLGALKFCIAPLDFSSNIPLGFIIHRSFLYLSPEIRSERTTKNDKPDRNNAHPTRNAFSDTLRAPDCFTAIFDVDHHFCRHPSNVIDDTPVVVSGTTSSNMEKFNFLVFSLNPALEEVSN